MSDNNRNEINLTRLEPARARLLNYTANNIADALQSESEENRNAVLWLFYHACEQRLTQLKDVADLIKVSSSAVSSIWSGKYGGALDKMRVTITQYRRRFEANAAKEGPGFVETSVAKRVFKYGDMCHSQQRLGFIFGDGQIGKTFAMQRHAELGRLGKTFYVRTPAQPTLRTVIKRLSEACHITQSGSTEKLKERLIATLNESNLIWVDEVHQAFLPPLTRGRAAAGIAALEMLREIADMTGCTVVFCGTNVWRDQVEKGEYKRVLSQLTRRGLHPMNMEATPKPEDLRAFARHYELPWTSKEKPPEDALERIQLIASQGIGKVQTALQMGSQMANKAGETYDWAYFIAADDVLNEL